MDKLVVYRTLYLFVVSILCSVMGLLANTPEFEASFAAIAAGFAFWGWYRILFVESEE